MTSEEKTGMPEYVEHRVHHFQQRYSWDCGIACVLMLLSRDQREEFLQNFTEICQEEGFGQSTWTIDLCYLLNRFNITYCMYTTMAGVNEEYQKQGYYEKIIDLDGARVRRRFADASAAGVPVVEMRASVAQLAAHAAAHGPALLLVDGGRLACELCRRGRLRANLTQCFGGGYRGHYIVVVGYSRDRNGTRERILYRDPGARARVCASSPRRLERARAAGTDHDVVLIYKNFR